MKWDTGKTCLKQKQTEVPRFVREFLRNFTRLRNEPFRTSPINWHNRKCLSQINEAFEKVVERQSKGQVGNLLIVCTNFNLREFSNPPNDLPGDMRRFPSRVVLYHLGGAWITLIEPEPFHSNKINCASEYQFIETEMHALFIVASQDSANPFKNRHPHYIWLTGTRTV